MERAGWASLSDYIGRPNVYTAFFVIQVIAFFVLPFATNAIVFQLLLFLILTCYGGGFASIPAYIGDLFGTKQLGAIHGYILTAWALAGVVGPVLLSRIYDLTNSYNMTMMIFGVLFAVALFVSIWIRTDIRRLQEKQVKSKPRLSRVA